MGDSTRECGCGCGLPGAANGASYRTGHAKKAQAALRPTYIVDSETGCWNWQRSLNPKGYPTLGGAWWKKTRRSILAHRIAWEDATGLLVPLGHTVDHLCRNRACVNPEHLEAVPHGENVRRGNKTKIGPAYAQSVIRHISEGRGTKAVGEAHGICVGQVRSIVRGETWGDIPCSFRDAAKSNTRPRGKRAVIENRTVVIPYAPGEAA